VNVTSTNPDIAFTRKLRDKGYGVTSWFAYGMEGDRLAMQILTPRKYELKLYEDIKSIDPKAFIISYEPKQINGGFWVKQVRKGRLFNPRRKNDANNTAKMASTPVTNDDTGASSGSSDTRSSISENNTGAVSGSGSSDSHSSGGDDTGAGSGSSDTRSSISENNTGAVSGSGSSDSHSPGGDDTGAGSGSSESHSSIKENDTGAGSGSGSSNPHSPLL